MLNSISANDELYRKLNEDVKLLIKTCMNNILIPIRTYIADIIESQYDSQFDNNAANLIKFDDSTKVSVPSKPASPIEPTEPTMPFGPAPSLASPIEPTEPTMPFGPAPSLASPIEPASSTESFVSAVESLPSLRPSSSIESYVSIPSVSSSKSQEGGNKMKFDCDNIDYDEALINKEFEINKNVLILPLSSEYDEIAKLLDNNFTIVRSIICGIAQKDIKDKGKSEFILEYEQLQKLVDNGLSLYKDYEEKLKTKVKSIILTRVDKEIIPLPQMVSTMAGGEYYEKYLKYKQKYLELKKLKKY
jgi:hypothetical protein